MKIQCIDMTEKQVEEDLFELDLYPDREFDDEIHVLHYKKESWGNIEYFKLFKECDEKNIRVIIYTSYVFLPIASLIGHKIIVKRVNLMASMYTGRIGETTLDRAYLYARYGIKELGGWYSQNAKKDLPGEKHLWAVDGLIEYYKERTMLIDQRAFDLWEESVHERFDPEKSHCEIKTTHYKPICAWLAEREDMSGVYKKEQHAIINEFNGSDHYLTYQILASVLKGCRFIGIAGAASLLSMALPVNCIYLTDTGSNVSENMLYMKGRLNFMWYGFSTVGFIHDRKRRESHGTQPGTWRFEAMRWAIENSTPRPAEGIEILPKNT